MNAWDCLLALALAACVALAARKAIRDARRGKHACGGDCSRCMGGCEGKRP